MTTGSHTASNVRSISLCSFTDRLRQSDFIDGVSASVRGGFSRSPDPSVASFQSSGHPSAMMVIRQARRRLSAPVQSLARRSSPGIASPDTRPCTTSEWYAQNLPIMSSACRRSCSESAYSHAALRGMSVFSSFCSSSSMKRIANATPKSITTSSGSSRSVLLRRRAIAPTSLCRAFPEVSESLGTRRCSSETAKGRISLNGPYPLIGKDTRRLPAPDPHGPCRYGSAASAALGTARQLPNDRKPVPHTSPRRRASASGPSFSNGLVYCLNRFLPLNPDSKYRQSSAHTQDQL